MEDYNGRMNFLGAVFIALVLFVGAIGFTSHDNSSKGDIRTASNSQPPAASVK